MIYVSLFIVFFFGVFAGKQGLYGSPEISPPTQDLRCTNGATPKAWDRMTAEGYMHKAQMAAETASQWVGVPAMKLAWATESLAWSAIVGRCWK